MEAKRSVKKTRAALVAGTLAAAIALTGTLAWRNMTQETVNQFLEEKNPGGRVHDDFDGENKDIYAENFTDEKTGMPVFVRICLREYMETGEEAGINRTNDSGTPIQMNSRKVTPLIAGADINKVNTWFLHKPGVEDPFHEFWRWEQAGSSDYMPTFNKNKDSLKVDVNGTYEGRNKVFDTTDPYSDYTEYHSGENKKGTAYYDADDNDVEETVYSGGVPEGTPGAGGTLNVNYKAVSETHTAHSTLNSLGVTTMEQWKADGMPICNKWVWDTDGWFYWPEPVLPETATGLLLDRVIQIKSPGAKCYYAIDLQGQFATAGDWGVKNAHVEADRGFYKDGITDDAIALLNHAATVEIGEDDCWYLPYGHNLYKMIKDDAGTLSDYISAGLDQIIGTEDDRTGVLEMEEDVVLDEKNYGKLFLKPTKDQLNYFAMGKDELLGTADDERLWVSEGHEFPEGLITQVADKVEVTEATDATSVKAGQGLQFSAKVYNGTEEAMDQSVIWSVAAAGGSKLAPGTRITQAGALIVGDKETAARLTITATSKLDDRVTGTYDVSILGAPNVKVMAEGRVTSIVAGKQLQLEAMLYEGNVISEVQPDFTWSIVENTRSVDVNEIKVDENGLLTVGRMVTGIVRVKAACTVEGKDLEGILELTVSDPEDVTVTVTEQSDREEVGPGGSLQFRAIMSNGAELEGTDVTWSVGTSLDEGNTLETVNGVSIDPDTGLVTVNGSYVIADHVNNTFFVKATATAPSAKGASGIKTFDIAGPAKIVVKMYGDKKAWVRPGRQAQLVGEVQYADGTKYPNQQVTWTVKNTAAGSTTTVDNKGVLHMDAKEPWLSNLQIVAESNADRDIKGALTVTVDDGKLRIDGETFIVLQRDKANHRALILGDYEGNSGDKVEYIQKYGSETRGNSWDGSPVRTGLQEWLASHPTLNSVALETDIYTRKYVRNAEDTYELSDEFVETKDRIFLLSEADVFGTVAGKEDEAVSKDYTNGVGKLATPYISATEATWKAKFKAERGQNPYEQWWWLRSSLNNDCDARVVTDKGESNTIHVNNETLCGVRPALWVDMDLVDMPNP